MVALPLPVMGLAADSPAFAPETGRRGRQERGFGEARTLAPGDTGAGGKRRGATNVFNWPPYRRAEYYD